MKNPYGKLILVFITSFLFFVFLSTLDNLKLFGIELNQIDFKIGQNPITSVDSLKVVKTRPMPIDTTKICNATNTIKKEYKRFLFIGDSMLEGLSKRFGAYTSASSAELYAVIWYGSTTKKWGTTKRLTQYIHKIHPDFIIICLGGNELFIRDIEKNRQKYVQSIVSEIGEIPFIWIGPPNWKRDTEINSMIKSIVGENRFFYSAALDFDRAEDGMHPTRESAIIWMDEIIKWMDEKGIYTFISPKYKLKNPTKTIVLTPND